jgi:DNA-directed RNA polymerase subunit RPC12/RpoP
MIIKIILKLFLFQKVRDYMIYVCGECKKEVTFEGLETLPGIKCPYCGNRTLYKSRPPVVKKMRGR